MSQPETIPAGSAVTISPAAVLRRRIDYLDLAKCLGLMLVIIGHTLNSRPHYEILRGVISSFHMPLFFIIAGFTFKLSSATAELRPRHLHSARRLLLPALVTYALYKVLMLSLTLPTPWAAQSWHDLDPAAFMREQFFVLVMSNALTVTSSGFTIPGLRFVWFLVALFELRLCFDALQLCCSRRALPLFCVLLSMLGVMFALLQPMPLDLDLALTMLPLFYLGFRLKDFDFTTMRPSLLMSLAFCYLLCLYITYPIADNESYLNLTARRYPFYPLCLAAAACAGVLVLYFCALLCRHLPRPLLAPWLFVGRHTLALFCLHQLDTALIEVWNFPDSALLSILTRSGCDLTLLLLTTALLHAAQALTGRALPRITGHAL